MTKGETRIEKVARIRNRKRERERKRIRKTCDSIGYTKKLDEVRGKKII